MIYIGTVLKIVFLVAVPITFAVYAALVVGARAEQAWETQRQLMSARCAALKAAASDPSDDPGDPAQPA